MATYYCDLAQDFDDQTGADNTGNEYYGGGGLQAAIWGWGNATALAAGETLYCKGTCDLSKLILIEVDVDKSGTWGISDVVQNHNDGGGANGDDWVGELVYIDATTIWLQINAASGDVDDVDTADGIHNVTQADEIAGANMLSAGAPGPQVGNNSGSTTGWIKFIGCATDWTAGEGVHANHNLTNMAILDGKGKATNCLVIKVNHVWFESLKCDAASAHNITTADTTTKNWTFRYCITEDAGNAGIYARYLTMSNFWFCVFSSNGDYGMQQPAGGVHLIGCRWTGNTTGAIVSFNAYGVLFGCGFYDESGFGLDLVQDAQFIANCWFDDVTTDSIQHADAGEYGTVVVGCRITNSGAYGIDSVSNHITIIEDWNYFDTNATADLRNVDAGANSQVDQGDANQGYTDPDNDDYNIADGATMDSTEANLWWDV